MILNRRSTIDEMLTDPKKAIINMIVPFLISLIVVQANVFTDTFWVSNLGVDAVSGMTSAVPLYAIFSNIGVGLAVGVTATVAFRMGKKEPEAASFLAGNAILLGIIGAIILSAIMFFLKGPLVILMGAQDVEKEIYAYVLPFILLSPITVLNSVFGGLLRAEGAANRSTIVQMSSVAVNMILDPLLIFGLGLGLTGAGLATVLSASVGIILSVRWYHKKMTAIPLGWEHLRLYRSYSMELLSVGGPRAVEGLTSNITILFQRVFIIMASGTVGVALFNVPFRYVMLCMIPAEALGMAMVPVVAANYGKGDRTNVETSFRFAMKTAICMSFVMMAALFLLSAPLIDLFTMEESMYEWRDAFCWNLRMYCIILPFFTVQTVCSSLIQAFKRSRLTMRIALIMGFVRMLLFWIASFYDYHAITYGLIASYVISSTLTAIAARRVYTKIMCKLDNPPDTHKTS